MKSELLKSRTYKIRFGDMSDNNYLKVVVPVREVSSAPHSRSCSLKKSRRRPQDLDLKDKFRPRTNSLPSCSGHQHRHRHGSNGSSRDSVNRAASSDKLCRVRSFKLTSKGLVNHGDCFKRLSAHSLMSTGSAASDLNQPASDHGSGGHPSTYAANTTITITGTTATTSSSSTAAASSSSCSSHRSRAHSEASEASSSGVGSGGSGGTGSAPSFFRVVLKGTSGVGKSALLRQFMTSEYRGTFDVTTPDTEDPETTVSVLLDGEESMLEFIDEPKDQEMEGLRADAYVLVFSLADHQSYISAVGLLRHLRVDLGLDRAVVLVGNKLDLVRQRRVEEREARTLAAKYDSHYQETSAALNHQVDDLLVAVLSQIRHSLAPPISQSQTLLSAKPPLIHCCSPSPRRAISFLSRLFTPAKKTKSFDNLLVH